MMGPRQALRLFRINWVLLRHGLDEVILATHLFRPLRWIKVLLPWHWVKRDLPSYPARVRLVLEDLGPIFVKFGQILSTRRDLLPDDLAVELAKLQDRVPPFDGAEARALIEKAWGRPIEEVLDQFDPVPLASASIAQVHTARLKDGTEVVVKVLRPGIERTIRQDLSLMYAVAHLAHKYWKDGRRLRPIEVVREYEKTIYDELDLQREAANASQLRRNWLGSEMLYIPEVYWDWTRPNVMVMERIYGTPVGEVDTLKAQGVSMKQLGERGVEIFFTQVFRDNFFHADMHPGNIFVEPSGRYISIDFGIVGTLTTEDQRYLAENLLAFFERDYRRVAELHVESGWVPPGTRVDEFEAAIRTVSEPIFEKPLAEISFGHFLVRLFQTARRFRHGDPAAAGAAGEDPAQHRGTGTSALSRTRPLDHGQALHGTLDEGSGGFEGAVRPHQAQSLFGGRSGPRVAADRLSDAHGLRQAGAQCQVRSGSGPGASGHGVRGHAQVRRRRDVADLRDPGAVARSGALAA
jgi:ubiquinone biosynthesis protein